MCPAQGHMLRRGAPATPPIKAGSMLARLLLSAGLVAALSQTALAQFYKGKTITMIINYPAGGPSDIEGRIVAQHLPALRIMAG